MMTSQKILRACGPVEMINLFLSSLVVGYLFKGAAFDNTCTDTFVPQIIQIIGYDEQHNLAKESFIHFFILTNHTYMDLMGSLKDFFTNVNGQ